MSDMKITTFFLEFNRDGADARLIAAAPTVIRELVEQNKRMREVLERLARLGNGEEYGNSEGNLIALTALDNDDKKETTHGD